MALLADQTAQVYKVFGVPQAGASYIAYALSTLYGPAGEVYDHAAIVTALTARLAAMTSNQETIITALLVRWEVLTDYNPLRVDADGGSRGVIVDYDRERRNIRKTLSNVIGFACPSGGFSMEASGGCGRLTR